MKNNRKNYLQIGEFVQDKKGNMHGKLFGLGLGVTDVLFEPQTSKDEKQYFRLIADPNGEAYEIGAAFPKQKGELAYYSVAIDSPVLPAPINGALFLDAESGRLNLVWNRLEEDNDVKAEATVNVHVQPQHETQTKRRTNLNSQPSV